MHAKFDHDPTDTPRHPIAVVADRTGLSQDVLRVWERRYAAVTPARDDGGQRLYSDADVTRLRLLRNVTEAGRPIGRMAALSPQDLEKLATEDAQDREARLEPAPEEPLSGVVASALASVRLLDGRSLDIELRRAAAVHGLPVFLESLVTPLLRRMGEEWHGGRLSPSQEHLASAVVESVLSDLTRGVATADRAPSLLLATPVGERHAIGALMAGLAAALEGWRVIFLGADLPAGEIASAAMATGARAVGVSVVYLADRDGTLAELRALRSALPRSIPMFAGGAGAAALGRDLTKAGVGIAVFADLAALRSALAEAAAGAN